jgi:hypothetical protein
LTDPFPCGPLSLWIHNADRIVFLGFGFWQENITLLGLHQAKKKRQERFSTGKGPARSIQAEMEAKYKIKFGPMTETAFEFVVNEPVFARLAAPATPMREPRFKEPEPTASVPFSYDAGNGGSLYGPGTTAGGGICL